MGVGQSLRARVTQVLVFGSIYQRVPFWYMFLSHSHIDRKQIFLEDGSLATRTWRGTGYRYRYSTSSAYNLTPFSELGPAHKLRFVHAADPCTWRKGICRWPLWCNCVEVAWKYPRNLHHGRGRLVKNHLAIVCPKHKRLLAGRFWALRIVSSEVVFLKRSGGNACPQMLIGSGCVFCWRNPQNGGFPFGFPLKPPKSMQKRVALKSRHTHILVKLYCFSS